MTDAFVHKKAKVRGKVYHYVDEQPSNSASHCPTLLLVHGFPDTWFGWRNQIKVLVQAGYRCIVPDMMGYGETDKPDDLHSYTFKSVVDDLVDLSCQQIGKDDKIIVIGHDWGGLVAWRFANWYPEKIIAVASICTPYAPPARQDEQYVPLEEIVKKLPNFTYQLFFASEEAAEVLQDQDTLRTFLAVIFRGANEYKDKKGGTTSRGGSSGKLDFEIPAPDKVKRPALLNDQEWSYYCDTFTNGGFKGPLSWYKTRRLNHEEERDAALQRRISLPSLMLCAPHDAALPPKMADNMRKHFEAGCLELQMLPGPCGHWANWEQSEAVNQHLLGWLGRVTRGAAKL